MLRMKWAWLLVIVLCLGVGCQNESDGLTKFPVTGTVTVNGRPVPLVVVNFQHVETSLPGRNARFPVGVTDENGRFQLSTNGQYDGAVPGEYVVTFQWLSGNDSNAFDRFQGALSNPDRSKFRCNVTEDSSVPKHFELNVPESKILPLKSTGNISP